MAEDEATKGDGEDPVDRAVRLTVDGINWETLGVIEHAGALHFPATIRRRAKDGTLTESPILLRPIDNDRRFSARIRARAWASDLKLDLDRDRDLVDELENYEILAFAIRDAKPPHDQHRANARELFRDYLPGELMAVWGKLGAITEAVDPRYGELDAEQIWRTIVRVAQAGEPSPLADMPSHEQAICIAFSAREACKSPDAPSWLRQGLTSSSD